MVITYSLRVLKCSWLSFSITIRNNNNPTLLLMFGITHGTHRDALFLLACLIYNWTRPPGVKDLVYNAWALYIVFSFRLGRILNWASTVFSAIIRISEWLTTKCVNPLHSSNDDTTSFPYRSFKFRVDRIARTVLLVISSEWLYLTRKDCMKPWKGFIMFISVFHKGLDRSSMSYFHKIGSKTSV